MSPVPPKIRKIMAADPFYSKCSLAGVEGHVCGGSITWEHTLIYAHRQIQEIWAIIPVCEAGQEVGNYQDAHTMVKEKNVWVALNRASDEELLKYSKVINYIRERKRLNSIYGPYEFALKPQKMAINEVPKSVDNPVDSVFIVCTKQLQLAI